MSIKEEAKNYDELKIKYDNLEQSYNYLRQIHELQQTFLNKLVRDIRTPMNAIIGYSELAKARIDKNDEQMQNFLIRINQSSQFLQALFNEVQDITNLDCNKIRRENNKCNLSYLIRDVYDLYVMKAYTSNIQLITELVDVQDLLIYCDKHRIRQILLNIVWCSMLMTKDGDIQLKVEQLSKNNESIGTFRFTIKDTGKGYDTEFVQNIFEPFDGSIKDDTLKDVAMNMYLTKCMVDMLDGSISVVSELGKGTEVIIEFSFVLQEDQVTTEEVDFTGRRILLVEDNDINRDVARAHLENMGFLVDQAVDGQEACDMLCELNDNYYDLIVMDLRMPVMDGFVATKVIRNFEDQRVAKIPIVAMSVDVDEDDREAARRVGMNGFLPKPLDSDDIKTTLIDVLRL